MPDIDLFFDREDERSLVQFILARGGWLVASSQKSARYERIETWEAYLAARAGGGQTWALENERLFFVLFNSYQECPLELHVIEGGYYNGTYSVSQRIGGPTIDFLANVQYHENGVDWISGGGLGYYPTYQNTITGEMERPPDALVQEYKKILSYVKKDSKLIKGQSGRKYFIGPHTYHLIQEGKLNLGVTGLSVP